jgi:hypothetical protein
MFEYNESESLPVTEEASKGVAQPLPASLPPEYHLIGKVTRIISSPDC